MRPSVQLQFLRDRYVALPYLTTIVTGAIIVLYLSGLLFTSSLPMTLALNTKAILHGGIYRLVTYPLVHQNFAHVFFNLVALVPVLSSFEEETGTIGTAGCLFLFSVVPGLAYVITALIFSSTAITLGASGWVFTLMAYFSLIDYAMRPTIYITPSIQIPTWSTPIITLVIIALLLPGSSFLGHLYGLLTGYGYGLGYLNFGKIPQHLILNSESVLLKYSLTKAIPRFVSDDSASKHRVVIDTTVDAGVPSGSTSPVLSPAGGPGSAGQSRGFSGQGRQLGS
ncbi:hypothetical protein V1525DRAFT_259784 [Lipomyces kononenkoae]|uniref:Uncharacterized protein n=1 Tax=Lipomyces kononenkoae TaxID=34357 RepID=A0ACC3SV99_LIPKO